MFKKIFFLLGCTLLLSACTNPYSSADTPLSLKSNAPTSSTSPLPSTSPSATNSSPNSINLNQEASMSAKAILKTAKGEITLKLYPDKAPKTVANFVQKGQSKYYQNLTFHRVEDWVIQGGDPQGTGTGGGQMPTELSNAPFKLGSLGVARGGDIRVSNDSQFFICTSDCSWLTGQYTNFGEVTDGLDIAKQITKGDKIISLTIVDDKPTKK